MKANTTQLKTRLEEELAELTSELKMLGVQNPHVPEDWIPIPEDPSETESDINIRGDRSEDWAERRGVLDALETRFNNINRALKKFDTDTYGICELGGEQIEADRLDANPAARTCKAHIDDEALLTN